MADGNREIESIIDEGAIWQGTQKVSQVLAIFRDRYTPRAGSPIIDAGDPADKDSQGRLADIGAVDVGGHDQDKLGKFGDHTTNVTPVETDAGAAKGGSGGGRGAGGSGGGKGAGGSAGIAGGGRAPGTGGATFAATGGAASGGRSDIDGGAGLGSDSKTGNCSCRVADRGGRVPAGWCALALWALGGRRLRLRSRRSRRSRGAGSS
jgi:hypothetical protein